MRMPSFGTWLTARLSIRSERGATAIEYAILASAIAVVIVLAVAFLGAATNDNFACTGDSWEQQTDAC